MRNGQTAQEYCHAQVLNALKALDEAHKTLVKFTHPAPQTSENYFEKAYEHEMFMRNYSEEKVKQLRRELASAEREISRLRLLMNTNRLLSKD